MNSTNSIRLRARIFEGVIIGVVSGAILGASSWIIEVRHHSAIREEQISSLVNVLGMHRKRLVNPHIESDWKKLTFNALKEDIHILLRDRSSHLNSKEIWQIRGPIYGVQELERGGALKSAGNGIYKNLFIFWECLDWLNLTRRLKDIHEAQGDWEQQLNDRLPCPASCS